MTTGLHTRSAEVPRPVERGDFRLKLGSLYFSAKRYVNWYAPGAKYARYRTPDGGAFNQVVAKHQSLLLRPLRNVDEWIQRNKVVNLKLAVACLNGLVLRPGETMSVWRLVGKPSKRKGYLPGMVLVNGEMKIGYGGGLCQMSNLLYWMTLHTALTVVERYRHQYDVFPDANRTLPFGSGATISYNYIDLQIRNDTGHPYYLRIGVNDTNLAGEWCTTFPEPYEYDIVERNHRFTQHFSGKYIRHNEVWRMVYSQEREMLREELIAENHALMMYSPMLQSRH